MDAIFINLKSILKFVPFSLYEMFKYTISLANLLFVYKLTDYLQVINTINNIIPLRSEEIIDNSFEAVYLIR